jgi:formylglycine-generating enzyme required for sulfatase activity
MTHDTKGWICATASAALLLALALDTPSLAAELPRTPAHTNSLGMELVRIEAGVFAMGLSRDRLTPELHMGKRHLLFGEFDERPRHLVTISRPFYMGQLEVTNAQYEQFDPSHRERRGEMGFSSGDDEAVVFVSWEDAVAFCAWLSEREGLPYRLPTEAEWEYAARAGTTTFFHTGDSLPEGHLQNPGTIWYPHASRDSEPPAVSLATGRTVANRWLLHDMHGNVEEWVHDWYGPYTGEPQTDPVGYADGDFRVTRGGSHSTLPAYLRSGNRSGTLPGDRSWMIGFRVVMGERPETPPLPPPPPPLNQQNVRQEIPADIAQGPDPERPYFHGPRRYVKIDPDSYGPLFSWHNHDPAIVECPNGDLLAIWYTTVEEPGRELALAASRLRYGAEEWEPASLFWDAPDRNDHAPALWADAEGRLFQFVGLSNAAAWGGLALVLRTSADSGATWSKARLIAPEHRGRRMPIETVIQTRDGTIVLPSDADHPRPGGASTGSSLWLSRDGGQTWSDPGGTIAGVHAGIVQLRDGRLMAFGRGDSIDGFMPKSLSTDMGRSWTYGATPFPPISGGQRLVLIRLQQGPLFLASFASEMTLVDAAGVERKVSGLYGALSYDDGETWPVRRLITDDGPGRWVVGGAWTGRFWLGPSSAEPKGYLSVTQTPDGVIQLISSAQHYAFNLAWLEAPMPGVASGAED